MQLLAYEEFNHEDFKRREYDSYSLVLYRTLIAETTLRRRNLKYTAMFGDKWTNKLSKTKQDYIVIPDQPWIDGFAIDDGFIRQFVAMQLGDSYTAEEQITGNAEFGGLQIIAYPMKREIYEALKEDERR